jgi:copper transport protein
MSTRPSLGAPATAGVCWTRGRAALVLAGVVAVMVASVSPAFAHAQFVGSSPVDGTTVTVAPVEVSVTFDEAVVASTGALRVFRADATRVDEGVVRTSADGRLVSAPLTSLGDGTHVVAWRVTSADGHPIRGAFTFHVGAPGGTVDGELIDLLVDRDGPAWPGELARWATYLAALTAIGLVVFPTIDGSRTEVAFVLRRVAGVGMVAAVLQVPLHAVAATGLGLGALASGPAWVDALNGPLGSATGLRLVAFVAIALTTARPTVVAWAGAVGLVVADLLVGHTRTIEPLLAVWLADAVHVASAGVWLGGLVSVAVTLGRGDPTDDARRIARFSTLAAWTVLALAGAGLVLARLMVGNLEALTTTTHGWALFAKGVVVVGVLGVAAHNNRVLVPAVAAEPELGGIGRLRRTIRWELAGLVVVVGVTAVLVNLPPAKVVAAPFSTFVAFGDDQVNLVVDPARAGGNEIHVYVLSPLGSPALVPGEMTLELSLPAEDIGPIIRTPAFAGPGHFLHVGPELALPGTWEVTVRQRVSTFEQVSVTIQVVVRR